MNDPPATSLRGGTPLCFQAGCVDAYKTIDTQKSTARKEIIGITIWATKDPGMTGPPVSGHCSLAQPYPGGLLLYPTGR
jgi:hypothetical protein